MQTQLVSTSILHYSGEIGKNKINLISGAMTLLFAEMVWAATDATWTPSTS